MRIYVASAYANREEVRAVMIFLLAHGHEITHDWTTKELDPAWPPEQQAEYLQKCGAEDFEGVRAASALVLVNHTESRDAMAEFGIALGMGKPVGVLYPDRRSSVFFHRARTFQTIDGLGAWLASLRVPSVGGRPCNCRGKK